MEISSQELKQKIASGEKLLIDFYGTFCGPCKVMKPWFEAAQKELKEENSETNLYLFNIDTDREYVINELGIKSVPTIKGFKGGELVFNNVGVLRKEQIIKVANEI